MGRYTQIAEVSQALVQLLQKELVPDILLSKDRIGLCSPAEHGDFKLGLHLYELAESEEIRTTEMVSQGINRQRYPASYLSLFYMITAYSDGDLKIRAEEEQKILGRVFQVLHDHAVLDKESLEPTEIRKTLDITIQFLPLTIDEKLKIYNFPKVPYKLSLFYKVSPVEIESTRVKQVQRVTSLDFEIKE